MTPFECEFEADVAAAALQSGWPERADAQLREHVQTCAVCADVARVVAAVDSARMEMDLPVLPDSGRVWWVAQMRARREAVHAAQRPLMAANAIAWICVLAAIGMVVPMAYPFAMELLLNHVLIVTAVGGVLLIAPAAVFLATAKD